MYHVLVTLIVVMLFMIGAIVTAITYGRSAEGLCSPHPSEGIVLEEEPVCVEGKSAVGANGGRQGDEGSGGDG
jgi:uncharacterized membrane protein